NYNVKKQAAQAELQKAEQVITNGDATAQQISAEKDKVEQALQALNDAKSGLRADKSELQTAYQQLIKNIDTNGKTPASIKKYQDAKANIQNQI
ncbi:FIVAR domain-containing protein, partial [Staphylococcus capitis]